MWVISVFTFGFILTVTSHDNPTLVFNVTESLVHTLENATSVKVFIETLEQQNIRKGQRLSLLYDLDCVALTDCMKRFSEGEKIMAAIGNRTDLDLILSITLNSLNETKEDLSGLSWIPKHGAKFLINFHQSTRCDEIYDYGHAIGNILPNVKPLVPGIGYDENLVGCETAFFSFIPPFVVVHLSLGNTTGLPDSYGLFRRRLSNLHSRQQLHLKYFFRNDQTSDRPITLYTSRVENVCQQHQLASFAEKWSDVVGQDEGIFVQGLYMKSPENGKSNGFSTIAKEHSPDILNLPKTLEIVSRYFDSVFLKFDDWKKNLNNAPELEELENQLKTAETKKLNLVLTSYYCKEIHTAELELDKWMASDRFPHLFVSTLLTNIKLGTKINTDKQAVEVLQRISSKFTIGCEVGMHMVTNRTYSTAAEVVKTCDNINGSLYVLKTYMNLQEKDLLDTVGYSYVFENIIRKELIEVKAFGDFILQQKPTARIMLYPILIPSYRELFSATNFCDDRVLYYHECHEAIINWSNCNNADIVLMQAVRSSDTANLEDWLSYLKPVSGNSYDTLKLAELHPYVIHRNFPDGINNLTVDPCINWETSRPATTKANYFQNQHVGAVIYTEEIRQNGQITTDEYKIMLQFVLNRFDFAQVVLHNNSSGNFIAACNWVKTQSNLIEGSNKILLSYRIPQTMNTKLGTNNVNFVIQFFDNLKENRLTSIHGIHFDYSTNTSSCIEDPLNPIFKLFAEAKLKNIKFGIPVDYNCCMNYIELLVSKNASSKPILTMLEQIGYLVCQEKHQIEELTNQKHMGKVLDSHQYLKRAFQEFSPHLELYFQVSLTDISQPSNGYSDAYMKTVSHFMQSAAAYDLSYLIIKAFDAEDTNSGWWKINNFTDLSDPNTFVEREFEYNNLDTWRPPPLSKESLPESETNSDIVLIVSIVAGILLTLCLVIISYIYFRYRRLTQFLSDEEVKEFMNGRTHIAGNAEIGVPMESRTNAEYMKFKTEFDIPLSKLHIDTTTILGSGNFGTVYKGAVNDTPTAIKQPNRDCSKTCFKSVLSEVKILSYIGDHPNVVGFLGAYTKEIYKGILYVATEFCSNGALEPYLRKKKNVMVSAQEQLGLSIPERERTLFLEDLYRFCFEISSGMDHIERKHIVHGDLSTRNVLLDDNYTCKIGDFGLSRKMYDYQKYVKTSQEPLPWKWMAHESLTKMEFTSKSDVWSFGVTCWEIFTLGSIPYSTFNWTIDFPDELKNGLRLPKPEFGCQKIYLKMLDCWNLETEQRPSFADLLEFFRELHNNSYIFLDADE